MGSEMMEQAMEELRQQLAESERKRDIAYSALATDEAERKRLATLCDQLSAELEQERARVERLRKDAETYFAVAEGNCKIAEGWERQVKELQAQLADADAQIRQFEQINDTRDELQYQNKALQAQVAELQAQLEGATPDGSRSWQCELTEAQERLEAALEELAEEKKGHKRCDEDFRSERAVRLKLEARLSSYHKHEQELRDILGWARSFQRCGLTIQPSRLVQLLQTITLHDGTAQLFFEKGNSGC